MQRKLEETRPADAQTRPFVPLGLLAGLTGVFIFGLTLPMTHFALEGFDAFTVGIGRAVPAAMLAGAVLWLNRVPFPPRRYWRNLCLTAAGIIFGFPICVTAAMQSAPAAHGGVILAMLPLASAMAAVVIAGERPSAGFWLAGVAGSALVAAYAMIEAGGYAPSAADFLLIGAVASAGIGYAYSGMLSRDLGGWQTISWALVFSLPAALPLTLVLTELPESPPPLTAWIGLVYVALMSQYVGFFFWNRGMALAGVARTGQLQLLQPFVTLPASALLLGETVGWRHAGFALAVVAVVAAGRRLRVGNRGTDDG